MTSLSICVISNKKNTSEKVQEKAGNTQHKGVYIDDIKKYLVSLQSEV